MKLLHAATFFYREGSKDHIFLGLPESIENVAKSWVGGHLASESHIIDPPIKFCSKSIANIRYSLQIQFTF